MSSSTRVPWCTKRVRTRVQYRTRVRTRVPVPTRIGIALFYFFVCRRLPFVGCSAARVSAKVKSLEHRCCCLQNAWTVVLTLAWRLALALALALAFGFGFGFGFGFSFDFEVAFAFGFGFAVILAMTLIVTLGLDLALKNWLWHWRWLDNKFVEPTTFKMESDSDSKPNRITIALPTNHLTIPNGS